MDPDAACLALLLTSLALSVLYARLFLRPRNPARQSSGNPSWRTTVRLKNVSGPARRAGTEQHGLAGSSSPSTRSPGPATAPASATPTGAP